MALKDTITNPKQKERYDRNFDSVETTFTQKELEEHDAEIRSKAIEEFSEKLKEKYPYFVEDVGFVEANKMLHNKIDEIEKELKGE